MMKFLDDFRGVLIELHYRPRYFRMCFASWSSISECRGTGCLLLFFGFI